MLKLERRESKGKRRGIIIALVVILASAAGLYMAALYFAPVFATKLVDKPIEVASLPAPKEGDNRLIIPRIGVDIPYAQGSDALADGAEWRSPNNGSPAADGNFVLAARRFSLQPTPITTIEKSPFYNLAQLISGDKIIIDYGGKRYGYEVTKSFKAAGTDTAVEAKTDTPTLTLYSIGGNDDERLVVQAKQLGEVAFN